MIEKLKEEIGEMTIHNSKIVCYNATKEKGKQMDAKARKGGSWVVEVCKADPDGEGCDDWFRISECVSGQTAVAIADALRNFMGCGIAGDELCTQTQVRLTEHKE